MRRSAGAHGAVFFFLCAAAWLAAAGCGSSGTVFATGPGSVTGDGLHRVRWSELGNEWLKPGTSLAGYSGIVLDPIRVSYHTQQGQAIDPHATPYIPTADEIEAIEHYYQETFVKELSGGAFRVVAGPGPGVLRITGRIVDLSMAQPQASQLEPDEQVYSATAGELTLLLDVRDAQSGAPLLRSAGRFPVAVDPVQGAEDDDPTMTAAALRQTFAHEAVLLRQRLVELRNAPAPSAP
jgi:hypothetical protein